MKLTFVKCNARDYQVYRRRSIIMKIRTERIVSGWG